MILDKQVLKLCTAPDGNVWAAEGCYEPCVLPGGVTGAMDHVFSVPWPQIRVIGSYNNAELIVKLLEQRQGIPILLASPTICDSKEELYYPPAAICRMRQCLRPASLGGWHEATESDRVAYMLGITMRASGKCTPEVLGWLHQHVAWPALTFIETVWPPSAAFVLGKLADPRWYVDPNHPSRVSRMQSFLGLYPAVMAAAVANTHLTIPARRCRITLDSWRGEQHEIPADELQLPGNFLWRVQAGHTTSSGWLRATQKFVAYLFFTWLDAIHAETTRQPDPLFDPAKIFTSRREISAYNAHMAVCGKRV